MPLPDLETIAVGVGEDLCRWPVSQGVSEALALAAWYRRGLRSCGARWEPDARFRPGTYKHVGLEAGMVPQSLPVPTDIEASPARFPSLLDFNKEVKSEALK